MIPINIIDETAPLEAVLLGSAKSFGGIPNLKDTYDPKSKEHIIAGTFPKEQDLVLEIENVSTLFKKYGVMVYRPENIPNYNQIFVRDISFVVGKQLVIPPVTLLRKKESDGIQYVISQVKNLLFPELDERIEGGDVIVWKGHLFVGYTKEADFTLHKSSRTNESGLRYLQKTFPEWKIRAFELYKSDENARKNVLHLDCCFQPVGLDKAVLYEGGFKYREDYLYIKNFFGVDNIFEITEEEMYEMNANFFSLAPNVVISDSSFFRLNQQLRSWGINVEEVKYREVSKMEGLLRCTTMPLRRRDV